MARVTKTRKPQAAPRTPMELLMYEHLDALRCAATPSSR